MHSFWENDLHKTDGAKLVVFNLKGLGTVSYESELDGTTEHFSDLAKLSKELKSVIIAGCDTDTYGAFRKSAVIADCGKLLGVSDGVYITEGSEYTGGVNFIVYKTSIGKIGVIIDSDIYSFDAVKAMSLSDADLIVCVYGAVENFSVETVVKAEAFLCGIPIAVCGVNYSLLANSNGETVYASSMDINALDAELKRAFKEVYFKRNGAY